MPDCSSTVPLGQSVAQVASLGEATHEASHCCLHDGQVKQCTNPPGTPHTVHILLCQFTGTPQRSCAEPYGGQSRTATARTSRHQRRSEKLGDARHRATTLNRRALSLCQLCTGGRRPTTKSAEWARWHQRKRMGPLVPLCGAGVV